MKYFGILMLLLFTAGCGLRERELNLKKRMKEVNRKEQELSLKERSLSIRRRTYAKTEGARQHSQK